MKNYVITAVTLSAIALSGCLMNLDKYPEKYPKQKCVNMPGEKVVYAINYNCSSCHKEDLVTAEQICKRQKQIINAVYTGKMPKIGKLSPEYKQTIITWGGTFKIPDKAAQ